MASFHFLLLFLLSLSTHLFPRDTSSSICITFISLSLPSLFFPSSLLGGSPCTVRRSKRTVPKPFYPNPRLFQPTSLLIFSTAMSPNEEAACLAAELSVSCPCSTGQVSVQGLRRLLYVCNLYAHTLAAYSAMFTANKDKKGGRL
ncbi:hypothetical protein L209DRAFT_748329 [Thermothelomyces heterothallicus CBS 203.75]